jgi:hypothetical protein
MPEVECCHRCMSAVQPEDSHCPHCGDRLVRVGRVRWIAGAAGGVLALLLVVGIMLLAVRQQSGDNGAPSGAPAADTRPALGS